MVEKPGEHLAEVARRRGAHRELIGFVDCMNKAYGHEVDRRLWEEELGSCFGSHSIQERLSARRYMDDSLSEKQKYLERAKKHALALNKKGIDVGKAG